MEADAVPAARRADRPLVNIVELRRRLGERTAVHRALRLDDLRVATTGVPDGALVEVDVELEAMPAGIAAVGHVRAPWVGSCRRCLEDVSGLLDVEVSELYAPDVPEGEGYPLGRETIDLAPLAREAVLLGLPLAPLCRDECPGPDPDDFPVQVPEEAEHAAERPIDPRWAALDVLRAEFEADDEGDHESGEGPT